MNKNKRGLVIWLSSRNVLHVWNLGSKASIANKRNKEEKFYKGPREHSTKNSFPNVFHIIFLAFWTGQDWEGWSAPILNIPHSPFSIQRRVVLLSSYMFSKRRKWAHFLSMSTSFVKTVTTRSPEKWEGAVFKHLIRLFTLEDLCGKVGEHLKLWGELLSTLRAVKIHEEEGEQILHNPRKAADGISWYQGWGWASRTGRVSDSLQAPTEYFTMTKGEAPWQEKE